MSVTRILVRPDRLLLGVAFLILSSSTVAWTLLDRTPPPWDPADHISAAYDYYRPLAHLNLAGFYREFFVEAHYYAPLVHLVTAGVFLVFGASELTGIAVNLVSLGILFVSVSWIGRSIYANGIENKPSPAGSGLKPAESVDARMIGAIAALLSSSYHFPAWLMHDAFLDYPLMAMVAASIALLIRARDFSSRSAAMLFGVSVALGMLTKQTFAFFLFLPTVYVGSHIVLSRNRTSILNFFLAMLAAAALAAIWYFPHIEEVIAIYRVNQEAAITENEAPVFTLASNTFYLHALISSQMQLPFGLLFVGGLVYSFARRRSQSVILYLWLMSGVAAFTLVQNKDVRYTVPVLPAAALISVCWLAGSRSERQGGRSGDLRRLSADNAVGLHSRTRRRCLLKAAAMGAITVWSLVSFLNAQWPAAGNGLHVDTPRFRWMIFARNYFGFDHRPLSEDWSIPAIVARVGNLPGGRRPAMSVQPGALQHDRGDEVSRSPDEIISPSTFDHDFAGPYRPILGVVINLPHLNPSSIALYARLLSRERAGPPLINVNWLVADSALRLADECDYILLRTGLDEAAWVGPTELQIRELIRLNPGSFAKVASFPIPIQDADAVLYRVKGDRANGE